MLISAKPLSEIGDDGARSKHSINANANADIYINTWYQPGARNGYGAHVVTIARDGQELIRVRRGALDPAIEEALRQAREQGLTITRDNTGMGLVGAGRARAVQS